MVILSETNTILFVCKGNICRSPFAKYYAEKILPKSMNILSSGHYLETGRRCPKKAVKAAKEFGIDLRNHRSTTLSKNLIQDAQIIYIFDEEDREVLLSLFPFAKKRIYFLGTSSEDISIIIPDPHGKKYSQYKRTYQLISQSIECINNSMEIEDHVDYNFKQSLSNH